MEIVPFWGAILFQSFGRIKKFAMKKIFFIIILSFLNKSFGQIVAVKQNDVAIVSQIPKDRQILFGPDYNLGRYLSKKLDREMILWSGSCEVHVLFSAKKLYELKRKYPDAPVIAKVIFLSKLTMLLFVTLFPS